MRDRAGPSGHEDRLDIADVFGAIEDFLEDNEVFRRVDSDAAALEVAFRAPLEYAMVKRMPRDEQFCADTAAEESGEVGLRSRQGITDRRVKKRSVIS